MKTFWIFFLLWLNFKRDNDCKHTVSVNANLTEKHTVEH